MLIEITMENHISYHALKKLKKEYWLLVWITSTLVLTVSHLIERKLKFLLSVLIMMLLRKTELPVVKLFQVLVLLELVLIS